MTDSIRRAGIAIAVVVCLLFAATALLLWLGAKSAALVLFDVTYATAILGAIVWSVMFVRDRLRSKGTTDAEK